jgi:hypothetical protein
VNTIDVSCGHCGADPGEACATKAGDARRIPHAARRDSAAIKSRAEARKAQEEEADNRKAMVAASLADPVEIGEDVASFLRKNLKIRVREKITCPEEGMGPDVWVELVLCDEVISRADIDL